MIQTEHVTNASDYEVVLERFLVRYDDEFKPPLSARHGTTQTDGLDDEGRRADIEPYLESCLEQHLIVAEDGGEVVGFLTFTVAEEKDLLEAYSPCVYVSTTIVEAEYRQEGVATALNRHLLDDIVPEMAVEYVARRTWSTNYASQAYIESLGFEVVKRVEDDRGEGIDTLYYAKRVNA